MKIFRIFTGVYTIIASAILLMAPIITITSSIVFSIFADGIPGSEDLINGGFITDIIFRILALSMAILAFILKYKSKEANKDGQVLIIVAGLIVVMLSSVLGFISGILGIIGGIMILISPTKSH